jgi:seryl-tRNA synthetase
MPCSVQFESDQKRRALNALQKDIGAKKKVNESFSSLSFTGTIMLTDVTRQAKENADGLLAQKNDLDAEIAALKVNEVEAEASLRKKANSIGNLVHDSVPVSNDEVITRVEAFALRQRF